MNVIEKFEREQMEKLLGDRTIPEFGPGDTVRVNVRIVEGERSRLQAFEGVCIARRNAGLNSSFTIRKVSYGEGVERVFPLYSPVVESLDVVRRGAVKRAKLYYLRERSGRSARIPEKIDWKRNAERAAAAAAKAAGTAAPAAKAAPAEAAAKEQ